MVDFDFSLLVGMFGYVWGEWMCVCSDSLFFYDLLMLSSLRYCTTQGPGRVS